LVWAGGAFGRAAAQARVWIKRLRDRIEERRAKARELAHRQARDAEMARAALQVAVEAEPAQETYPAQETEVSEAAASPATDLAPLEEPVTSTESIVRPFGSADGSRLPELTPQQLSAIQTKRKRRRGRGKSGGGASQGADEAAKP
jgi:hypothetical protein